MLERASVVGLEFEWEALGSSPDGRGRRGLLSALVRKELIRPHEAIEDTFRFRHMLIRDAAYERIQGARSSCTSVRGGSTAGRGVRRDRRLPPRAGVPLPAGSAGSGAGLARAALAAGGAYAGTGAYLLERAGAPPRRRVGSPTRSRLRAVERVPEGSSGGGVGRCRMFHKRTVGERAIGPQGQGGGRPDGRKLVRGGGSRLEVGVRRGGGGGRSLSTCADRPERRRGAAVERPQREPTLSRY